MATKGEVDGYKPAIPDMVRTVIYSSALAWGFIATFLVGAAAVLWPAEAKEVLAVVGAVSSAFAFLTGATGVAYRPTAHRGA